MEKGSSTNQLVGGILLIVGTCIGGGMLALPVTNGPVGFVNSSLFLLLIWLIMAVGALLILEINLWLPEHSNIVSMAKKTLGKPGQVMTWVIYLFLFYALLSAYISGGADILQSILAAIHLYIPYWLSMILFTGGVACIIYKGIFIVDTVNRGLIYSKFLVYFILVFTILPRIELPNLAAGNSKYISGMVLVLLTSFGYSTLIPSLRTYFKGNVKNLRKAVIIGSFIPLVFYILWDLIIIGVIPQGGEAGLIALLHSNSPNSGLAADIQYRLSNDWVTGFYRFFTSVCILTSFLGVSLCVFDFLADGLKLKKKGQQGLGILAATFIPPAIIVLFYPGIFIQALGHACAAIVVLLLLMPVMMAWSGRYIKGLPVAQGYQVAGGKFTLMVMAAISIVLISVAITQF